MMKTYKKFIEKLYGGIASTKFFIGVMVLFTVQALWVAISSNLLPYDEYYHLGIIRFYAQQWSPFISNQPAEMSLYGDVTRLPSYIYHYAMSFPYRFFSSFIENEQLVVVILRFMNIAMIVGGLILFRRLLLQAKISRRVANFSLALFALLPIMPILGAQNNYDNLMFLLTPLFLGGAYKLVTETPSLQRAFTFLSIGMLATLVKHNFIVVFLIVSCYVLVRIFMKYHMKIFEVLKKDYAKTSKKMLAIAAVFFVISTGLFVERHGINTIRYRQIKVDCAKVQPREVCQNYSPWRRNQAALAKNFKAENLYSNPVSFSIHWVTTITRGFNAVYANIVPDDLNVPDPYGHYVFKPVMPIMLAVSYVIIAAAFLVVLLRFKFFWNNEFFRLSLLAFVVLAGALWIFNYAFYLKYGRAYAVQARYLLPLLPPLLAAMATGARQLIRQVTLRQTLAVALLATCIYSGGIMGWLVRSDQNWYIKNDTIIQIHQGAQWVLNKIVIH